MTAPFPIYGGKHYYADQIIAAFPEHRVYIEPFAGAANVLLRKPHAEAEILNDLDGEIVNFFRVLQDEASITRLRRMLDLTPHAREVFEQAVDEPVSDDPVERAHRFFVVARQARGGLGTGNVTKSSFSVSTRKRNAMAENVSKWLTAVDGLGDVAARLKTIEIEHLPAIELIRKYDASDAMFYCDPPYLPETRNGGKADTYRHEMSLPDHVELLTVIRACKGQVVLSGYPSALYDERLVGWRKVCMEARSHVANSGEARTEVLWIKAHEANEAAAGLFLTPATTGEAEAARAVECESV